MTAAVLTFAAPPTLSCAGVGRRTVRRHRPLPLVVERRP